MEGAIDPENITDEKLLKQLLPRDQFADFMAPESQKAWMEQAHKGGQTAY